MIGIFEQRLGPRVSVLHSRITQSERVLEWLRVREGEADVVIGARSAVFAPFKNLGLIIMDEEQKPSFRQDETLVIMPGKWLLKGLNLTMRWWYW